MAATAFKPMHPGELLREEIFPSLGRPITELAEMLGVSRQSLHAILAERAAVTPAMALRLGQLCGNGPELWLNLQARYDLAAARAALSGTLERIPRLAPSQDGLSR